VKSKNQKQEEAILRQMSRDKRSAIEQMNLLDSRPGDSKKEKNRLLVLVA
jgi:hypothetical protein